MEFLSQPLFYAGAVAASVPLAATSAVMARVPLGRIPPLGIILWGVVCPLLALLVSVWIWWRYGWFAAPASLLIALLAAWVVGRQVWKRTYPAWTAIEKYEPAAFRLLRRYARAYARVRAHWQRSLRNLQSGKADMLFRKDAAERRAEEELEEARRDIILYVQVSPLHALVVPESGRDPQFLHETLERFARAMFPIAGAMTVSSAVLLAAYLKDVDETADFQAATGRSVAVTNFIDFAFAS